MVEAQPEAAPAPVFLPHEPVATTPPQQEQVYEEIAETASVPLSAEAAPIMMPARAPPLPPRLDSVDDVGPPPSAAPPQLPARPPPQAAAPQRGPPPPGPPIPGRPPPIPVRTGNMQFPTGAPPPIPARQAPRPS